MLMSFFIPNSAAESKNYNIFGLAQLLWIVIPLAILIVACLIFRNRKKEGRILLIILASTMLLFRVLKYFVFKPFVWDEGWEQIVPFELCTIMSWIFPFTVYFKTNKLNTFIYPLGIIGGVVTLAYSEWIFNGRGLDFNKFESLIIHWILIAIPYIKVAMGEFSFKIKEIYRPFLALSIILLYSAIANAYITPGANHNYLRSNPLPFQIPGLHHLFTLGLIGIVFMLLMYLPFVKFKKVK
jgi:uncharacterized membrane protein YwaF